jgi:predicted Zn-dependent protease
MKVWIAAGIAVGLWVILLFLYARRMIRYTEVQRFDGRAKAVFTELGKLNEAGDPAAIAAWYARITRKWKGISVLHLQYSDFLMQQKRPDEAIKVLRRLLRRERQVTALDQPAKSHCALILVRNLMDLKRFDEADSAALDVLRRHDPFPQVAAMYVRIADRRGDMAGKMARIEYVLGVLPNDATLFEMYVAELQRQNRNEEAEQALVEAQKRFPRAESMAIRYAKMAHDRGDWEEAVLRWAELRDNFIFCKDGYEQGAVALRALGREQEAETVLATRPRPVGQVVD